MYFEAETPEDVVRAIQKRKDPSSRDLSVGLSLICNMLKGHHNLSDALSIVPGLDSVVSSIIPDTLDNERRNRQLQPRPVGEIAMRLSWMKAGTPTTWDSIQRSALVVLPHAITMDVSMTAQGLKSSPNGAAPYVEAALAADREDFDDLLEPSASTLIMLWSVANARLSTSALARIDSALSGPFVEFVEKAPLNDGLEVVRLAVSLAKTSRSPEILASTRLLAHKLASRVLAHPVMNEEEHNEHLSCVLGTAVSLVNLLLVRQQRHSRITPSSSDLPSPSVSTLRAQALDLLSLIGVSALSTLPASDVVWLAHNVTAADLDVRGSFFRDATKSIAPRMPTLPVELLALAMRVAIANQACTPRLYLGALPVVDAARQVCSVASFPRRMEIVNACRALCVTRGLLDVKFTRLVKRAARGSSVHRENKLPHIPDVVRLLALEKPSSKGSVGQPTWPHLLPVLQDIRHGWCPNHITDDGILVDYALPDAKVAIFNLIAPRRERPLLSRELHAHTALLKEGGWKVLHMPPRRTYEAKFVKAMLNREAKAGI